MKGVASFSGQQAVVIPNLKRVNLLYGQNRTGKSTVSCYLQDTDAIEHYQCNRVLENPKNYEIVVYNTDFSDANLLAGESCKGVFTLGEESIEAEKAINDATAKIYELETQ